MVNCGGAGFLECICACFLESWGLAVFHDCGHGVGDCGEGFAVAGHRSGLFELEVVDVVDGVVVCDAAFEEPGLRILIWGMLYSYILCNCIVLVSLVPLPPSLLKCCYTMVDSLRFPQKGLSRVLLALHRPGQTITIPSFFRIE